MNRTLFTARAVCCAAIATVGLIGAPAAGAADTWGAIAVSPQGDWGTSVSQPDEMTAKQVAKGMCGNGCKVVATFAGQTCAALVKGGTDNKFYTATDSDPFRAFDKAQRDANNHQNAETSLIANPCNDPASQPNG